jgi:hypothetical protein
LDEGFEGGAVVKNMVVVFDAAETHAAFLVVDKSKFGLITSQLPTRLPKSDGGVLDSSPIFGEVRKVAGDGAKGGVGIQNERGGFRVGNS